MRLPIAMLAFVLACFCGRIAPAYAGAFVVRDDLDRDISFTTYPQRIITLLPSLTETVCAVGACTRLVATDRFSDWPAEVRNLPKVGDLDNASVESIVNLRPDLILISRSQRITQRLAGLGIRTFALDAQSYADIGREIRTIGRILGLPDRAAALEESIDATVRDIGIRATARRRGSGFTVYFEVDRGPYAAGPESFIGELLNRLGTRNIVTADLGAFPLLNPEYVVRHDPDVIFVGRSEAGDLAQRPGWGHVKALVERHVCSLSPAERDTIVRPGPRAADGMRALAACLDRF